MKNKSIIHNTLAAVLLLAGCASHHEEKPVLQRGWIGGRYERAKRARTLSEVLFGADHTIYGFPPALTNSRNAGILTLALATNTPAYLAGLREGDLILDLGRQPVTDLPGFRRIVTGSQPGAMLPVKAFRDGQTLEFNVAVGREKYQEAGRFTIMLPGYVAPPHPVPTCEAPWFSLVALGFEKNDDPPVEFGSVKERYKQICHPKGKQEGHDQDWRFWLAIMELQKGKKILAQEAAAAP